MHRARSAEQRMLVVTGMRQGGSPPMVQGASPWTGSFCCIYLQLQARARYQGQRGNLYTGGGLKVALEKRSG